MKLTKHARRQAQRRGIEIGAIDLVISLGEEIRAGGGRHIYRLPYRELEYLAEECPPMLWRRYRDRIRCLAAVTSSDGQTVVTAMHRYKPLWKRLR